MTFADYIRHGWKLCGIEPGKKSIAIAVTLQPRDKTMTDAEIDALGQKIVAEVTKKTGGVLRA